MNICIIDSSWTYTLDSPYNEPLGGTQSAICYFLEELALQSNNCYLFNKFDDTSDNVPKIIKNVTHVPFKNILNYINETKIIFDIVIVSCLPYDVFQLKNLLKTNNTLFCLWTGHDTDQNASKLLKDDKAKEMIDLYIFVSDWQRNRYIQTYNIKYKKTMVMKNGIGKPFEKYLNTDSQKVKNSMAYCSIPWRGMQLLPDIYKKVNDFDESSTLNIYSGMNIYKQEDTDDVKKIYSLFDSVKNVNVSPGVSSINLATALNSTEFLVYPNIFPETSCITVLQAMACGCIVITSDLGALKETMGGLNKYININLYNFNKDEYISNFSTELIETMQYTESIKNMLRISNKNHIKNNYTWKSITNTFLHEITSYIQIYKTYTLNIREQLVKTFLDFFNEKKWSECVNIYNQMLFTLSINEYYIIKLNLGVCYYNLNNIDMSKKCFKQCNEIKSDYDVNKNIALLELQRNNISKFIKYARTALGFKFDIEIANLLAEKYELLGLYHDSISMYENIIYLDNENINSFNNLGNLNLLRIAQTNNIDDTVNNVYLKSLLLCDKNNEHRKKELVLSNMIFNNLYNWKLSAEETFKKSCIWYDYFKKDDKLSAISNRLNRIINPENKRIKIGYMSCDFITHPVGFMFNSILKNHNVDEFEIMCYDCSDTGKRINDKLSQELRNYNNAVWKDLNDTTDEEALNILIDDELDILVDMMGHTRNTRMNVLQYKPAKIIISYFAYPSTNGLKEIDYRFTDKYATPIECQKYFVEKLYYLPNGFQCYTPPITLDSTKDYTRDKYKIHLCCFNNPTKLSIPTIDVFSEILKKLPNSKLFLRYCYYKSSFYKACVFKLFKDRGIDESRLDIGFEQIIDGLKLYNKMDIALDPFPYNGGTISSECIYMNTPFITLAGTNYVSRVGVSLLSNIGLTQYVAKTTFEYIDKVVALANNEEELKSLHDTLRVRMLSSDLANSISFTKNIENAYKDIVSKY